VQGETPIVGNPRVGNSTRPTCSGRNRGYVCPMTLAAGREVVGSEFVLEDITTGVHASGFGEVGDGRSFSFHVEHHTLVIEVYRPRLAGPVPLADDVVALARRSVLGIDLTDERSLAAAVRDEVRAAASS
jgi:hypothetical protein